MSHVTTERRKIYGLFEIFMIGVGLSMDAFAVAICKGLNMHRLDQTQTLVIALFFGGFQALMPFWAGCSAGSLKPILQALTTGSHSLC